LKTYDINNILENFSLNDFTILLYKGVTMTCEFKD
jgi:hypothetical protein